jgi:hypothetical protein
MAASLGHTLFNAENPEIHPARAHTPMAIATAAASCGKTKVSARFATAVYRFGACNRFLLRCDAPFAGG